MVDITISIHPHQVAALDELHDRYPHVDRAQLIRLIVNVGLQALPNDVDALLCLEAGDALSAERAN
jgi:hypothetical protein